MIKVCTLYRHINYMKLALITISLAGLSLGKQKIKFVDTR
jgi:hypothetical protein